MSSRRLRSGRHAHVEAAQPVVEVGAEQAPLHQRRERAVGRGDDADVEPARAVAADPLDGHLLNRAQQLGLGGQRQVGDFVEEQRAAVGVLELAASAAHAGGRPFLDAEELGFEQRLDERGAVDGDEGPGSPRAEVVDLAGDELLAGAALTLDEHGEIRHRHSLDALAQRPHDRARADERGGTGRSARVQARRPTAISGQRQRSEVSGGLHHLPVPRVRRTVGHIYFQGERLAVRRPGDGGVRSRRVRPCQSGSRGETGRHDTGPRGAEEPGQAQFQQAVQAHLRVARHDVFGQRPDEVMHTLAPVLGSPHPLPLGSARHAVRHAALRAGLHSKRDASRAARPAGEIRPDIARICPALDRRALASQPDHGQRENLLPNYPATRYPASADPKRSVSRSKRTALRNRSGATEVTQHRNTAPAALRRRPSGESR